MAATITIAAAAEAQVEGAGYDGVYAPKGPWRPYESASLETAIPLFRSLPGAYYRWRWMVLWPMHTRLPRVRLPLLGWRLDRLTVGEVLVGLALLAITVPWSYKDYHTTSAGVRWYVHPVGLFLLLCMLLGFRNSAFTFLLGLSHERGLGWHALTGTVGVLLGVYHGVLEHTRDPRYQGYWDPGDTRRFISGWVSEGMLVGMVVLSAVPQLRRAMYSVWKATHVTLLLLALGALCAHQARGMIAAVVLWGLDLALRWGYMAGHRNPRQVLLEVLPGRIVKISWPGISFQYTGGQYVFINLPGVSWAEFHPFSLSSTPNSTHVHVHVRMAGDWTERLLAYAERAVPGEGRVAPARIEGPYGSPEVDLHGDRYAAFLLIAGGVGVTPQQSIYNHLLQQRERGRPVRLLRMVWAVGGAWAVHERTMVPEVARSMRYSSFRTGPSGPTGHWVPPPSRTGSLAQGRSAYDFGAGSFYFAEEPESAAWGPGASRRSSARQLSRDLTATSLRQPSSSVADDGGDRPAPYTPCAAGMEGADRQAPRMQQEAALVVEVGQALATLLEAPSLEERGSSVVAGARSGYGKGSTAPETAPQAVAESAEDGTHSEAAPQQRQQEQQGGLAILHESQGSQERHLRGPLKPQAVVPVQPVGDFIATEFYLNPDKAGPIGGMVPGLTPGVYAGRPDLPATFIDTALRARRMGLSRVAVCVCGPEALMVEVRGLTLELSRSEAEGGVAFDLNAEVFDF